jgi:outer membrane lipoprotein-sorting protein
MLRAAAAGALICVMSLASAADAAGDFDIGQLTQLLAQAKPGEATFTERRQVAMLDKPLESSGTLSFEPPDTFVRETLKPRRERLAVVGNTLTMSRDNRSRTLELDSSPEAAVVVEAIRGTLTGNRASLERHFSTAVSGSAEHWSLELTPLEARLREKVSSMKLSGEQSMVREVQVLMPDGDRSVMTIEPVGSAAR